MVWLLENFKKELTLDSFANCLCLSTNYSRGVVPFQKLEGSVGAFSNAENGGPTY